MVRVVLVVLFTVLWWQSPAQNIVPKTIRHNFFAAKDTLLPHPLNMAAVMRTLFPGNFYRIDEPSSPGKKMLLEEWTCPACPISKMEGWYVGEMETFPSPRHNRTELGDTISFSDDSGRQNMILSFSTIEALDEDIHVGRYSCAFMGLAWWRHEGAGWRLVAFSPAVGCFGAFKTIPPIKLIKLGRGNYGCYILNANGSPGDVYYGDVYVFGVTGHRFSNIMRADQVTRSNVRSSNWEVKLTSSNSPEPFSELRLVMTGDFHQRDFTIHRDLDTGDTIANAPREIRTMKPLADSFNFRIIRTYRYIKGWYAPVRSRMRKW